jgi:ankyrin repeat protein
MNGHEAVIRPDSKDNNGLTPLTRAAENGQEAVVKLLLATGWLRPRHTIICQIIKISESSLRNGNSTVEYSLLISSSVSYYARRGTKKCLFSFGIKSPNIPP